MRYDDEDYPLLAWAADRDVVPDPACGDCWGAGFVGGWACECFVTALRAAFAEAFDEAVPRPGCPLCEGDGETFDGELCPCLLAAARVCQEQLEIAATPTG